MRVCFAKWCHVADLTLQPAFSLNSVSQCKLCCYCFSQLCSVHGTHLLPFLWSLPSWGQLRLFFLGVESITNRSALNILIHVWHTCKYFSSYWEVEWLGHGVYTIQILMNIAGCSLKWLGLGMPPPAVWVSMSLPPAHMVIMSSCYISANLMGRKGHLTLVGRHLDH